jgi:glycosyltransferase involved in cell wall biosynthesis
MATLVASGVAGQGGPAGLLIGGNDRSLHANRGDLVRELLSHGLGVHAALPDEPGAPPLGPHDIRVHRLPMARTGMNPLADLRSIRALEALLGRLAPEAVLAYNPKPVIHAGLALRRFPDVRLVALITGRGALERRPGLKGRVAEEALSALYRASLSRPDVILFQNDDDRAFFEARFPAARSSVVEVIAGSGVSLDRFPRFPLPAGPVRFLLVAKLLVDKGVREFVEAARQVARAHPGARFRVVGGLDRSLPHALPVAEVEGWKAEGFVEFTGQVDDVRPHLAWSSVLCHPSYAEGTPRAVLEALATGRPIITTDAPGCRQTIEPGVSGFLVPPRDAVALARAMASLAGAAPDRLQEMAHAAYERARTVYDVRLVNARILEHLGVGGGVRSSHD